MRVLSWLPSCHIASLLYLPTNTCFSPAHPSTQICSNVDVDGDCRRLALEVLVSLASSAPGMIRKIEDFAQRVVPLCLQVGGWLYPGCATNYFGCALVNAD